MRAFGAEVPDGVVIVPEREAVAMCRRLAAGYGIAAGGSTGSVLAAVARYLPILPPGASVTVIAPDTGDRYLDTVYNDDWVQERFGTHTPSSPELAPVHG